MVQRRGFGSICNVSILKRGAGYPDVYENILCGFFSGIPEMFQHNTILKGGKGVFSFLQEMLLGYRGGEE